MISHIMDSMRVESVNRPKTGNDETTMEPCAYKIKDKIFIWDMPGLGGILKKAFQPLSAIFRAWTNLYEPIYMKLIRNRAWIER